MPYVKKKKREEDVDFLPGKSRRSGYFKKDLDDRGNKREMVKLLGKYNSLTNPLQNLYLII